MLACFSTSIGRQDAPALARQQGLILLLLGLGVMLMILPPVDAAVDPRPAKISMSGSADYAEMIFVVYRTKADDPWATGIRADPTTATIVPADTGVEVRSDGVCAVLAVPRALAEKTKGVPDPAWLESAAPGVIRVPGTFWVPHVYRGVTLRYQLDKTDAGPKLTLLNPEELKAAQRHPPGERFAEDTSPSPWSLVAGGGVLLVGGILIGGILAFWLLKRHDPPAAPDARS